MLRYRHERPIRQCRASGWCITGLVSGALLLATPVQGQAPADTVHRAIRPDFKIGSFHRWIWGDDYRSSWRAEIPIQVLDLGSFGGGLTPVEDLVGPDVRALGLRGADGRAYVFRAPDKDPTIGLLPVIADSPAGEILRDQVSAEHPLGAIVSQRFDAAAGISVPEPRLFVMPDDPRLGEFLEEFGGTVGLLSELPGAQLRGIGAFDGFAEIVEANELFDRIMASQDEVIDSRHFLAARLVDMLVGDWDRHRGQWRWGRRAGSTVWVPIPVDRDQALLRLDGVIPGGAHIFARQFVSFDEEYPDIVGLHYVAREVDRRFLVDMDWPTWDSVTRATQAKLTDDVIDEALARLPETFREMDGSFLREALRNRRDEMPGASRRLYELLSDDVEVQFTDLAEAVNIRGLSAGRLEVTAAAAGSSEPFFQRVFDPADTRELRLHLWGGDDVVAVEGESTSPIMVRIIGGEGLDRLQVQASLGRVKVYDRGRFDVVSDADIDVAVDRDTYDTWVFSEENPEKPIDWGTWIVPAGDVGMSSDYGLFVGGGITRYSYGFRRRPYASRIRVVGGISTQAKVRLEVEGDFRREASPMFTQFFAGFSQLNVVNFFGFGNDTEKPDDSRRHRIARHDLRLEGAVGRQFGDAVDLTGGVAIEASRTRPEEDPSASILVADSLSVYGAGDFGQVALFATLGVDTRDFDGASTKGARLDIRGSLYPSIVDVEESYFRLAGTGSTFLSAHQLPLNPTLALRGGVTTIFGEAPFFNAALLGGSPSVRGFDAERFAGGTSVFGTVELRLLMDWLRIAMLGDIGVLGFVDTGRVWYEGESPGGWHVGYGGGIWATVFGPGNTVSGVVGLSEEQTSFYFWFGMPF